MTMITFAEDDTYLPVTMKQFEELTNEILISVNQVTAPNALDGDYMAQILMSAIHAYDHKHGLVSKKELFESCINRISCHVTYHAVQEIQARMKAKQEEAKANNPESASQPTEPGLQLVNEDPDQSY